MSVVAKIGEFRDAAAALVTLRAMSKTALAKYRATNRTEYNAASNAQDNCWSGSMQTFNGKHRPAARMDGQPSPMTQRFSSA